LVAVFCDGKTAHSSHVPTSELLNVPVSVQLPFTSVVPKFEAQPGVPPFCAPQKEKLLFGMFEVKFNIHVSPTVNASLLMLSVAWLVPPPTRNVTVTEPFNVGEGSSGGDAGADVPAKEIVALYEPA
jgi:hypothetical protein